VKNNDAMKKRFKKLNDPINKEATEGQLTSAK